MILQLGATWFDCRLCEQAFYSRSTVRKEGQELRGETPNGLNASAILLPSQESVNAIFVSAENANPVPPTSDRNTKAKYAKDKQAHDNRTAQGR
jgi:hypothetical protein